MKDIKRKRGKRIVILAICEVIALCFIFGYAFIYQKYSNIQRLDFKVSNVINNDISVESVKKMKGYWNIAVFGVDSRTNSIGKGNNSDVILIVRIDRSTGAIKLVSVYRDSYLDAGKGKYAKINSAYARGGPEQAVRALNKNLDLNITDYVSFNWKGVATLVNILGGVDINITRGEFRYINSYITETVKGTGIGSHQLKSTGMQHLDGIQAVAYCRLRYCDTDFVRTERQREVIRQCLEKAQKLSTAQLNEILDYMLPLIATNLTVSDGLNAIKDIKNYHIEDTAGFPFSLGDLDMGSKGWNVIPTTLPSNVKELHKFLFGVEDYQPSKTVRAIGDKIASDTKFYKEGKMVQKYDIKETVKDDKSVDKNNQNKDEKTRDKENTSNNSVNKIHYEIDDKGNIIWLFEENEDGTKFVPSEEEKKMAQEDAKKVKAGALARDVMSDRQKSIEGNEVKDTSDNKQDTIKKDEKETTADPNNITEKNDINTPNNKESLLGPTGGDTDDANDGPGLGKKNNSDSGPKYPGDKNYNKNNKKDSITPISKGPSDNKAPTPNTNGPSSNNSTQAPSPSNGPSSDNTSNNDTSDGGVFVPDISSSAPSTSNSSPSSGGTYDAGDSSGGVDANSGATD